MHAPCGNRHNNRKFEIPVMTTVYNYDGASFLDFIPNGWIKIYPMDFTGVQNLLLLWIQKRYHTALFQSPPWLPAFLVPGAFYGLPLLWC